MRLLAALLFVSFTTGCGGLLISAKQERELGAGVHEEIKKQYKLLEKDDPITSWAVAMVKPLEGASKRFRDPAELGGYKVAVIYDDKLINAFAAPGGYTYLSTGLILSATSCTEIAGVMGHELAHVTQKHGVQAMEQQVAAGTLAQWFLGDGVAHDAILTAFGVVQSTQFSRAHEAESDEVGVQIAYAGGYNPYGLVTFFEKLLAQHGSGGPEFLSSHPATDRRIADTSDLIKRKYPDLRRNDPQRDACQGSRLTLQDVQGRIRQKQVKVAAGTGTGRQVKR
ncbi:MAG: M48 family metalloprotease [Myxococcales bacterium]|nr:M48 family metalloprotease [Myxococcales bacterium]